VKHLTTLVFQHVYRVQHSCNDPGSGLGSLQACEQATIAGVVGSKEQKDCFAEHTVCERFDSGRGDGLGSSS